METKEFNGISVSVFDAPDCMLFLRVSVGEVSRHYGLFGPIPYATPYLGACAKRFWDEELDKKNNASLVDLNLIQVEIPLSASGLWWTIAYSTTQSSVPVRYHVNLKIQPDPNERIRATIGVSYTTPEQKI